MSRAPAATVHDDQWIRDPNEPGISEDVVIQSGCIVRLRNPARESFFCLVEKVDRSNKGGKSGQAWIGIVNNHLVRPAPYGFGDRVRFRRADVIELKTRQDVEDQKRDPVLVLALQLVHRSLVLEGVVTPAMGSTEISYTVETYLALHPERFRVAHGLAQKMLTAAASE